MSLSDIKDIVELGKELETVTPDNAKERFTELFVRGCTILELNDEDAAREFETSIPNVRRWKHGLVVPPAASLILRFMAEKLDQFTSWKRWV